MEIPPNPKEPCVLNKTVFYSAVALLRYIADCCLPDLHPVPSFLVSRVLSPTEEDYQKLVCQVSSLNYASRPDSTPFFRRHSYRLR